MSPTSENVLYFPQKPLKTKSGRSRCIFKFISIAGSTISCQSDQEGVTEHAHIARRR